MTNSLQSHDRSGKQKKNRGEDECGARMFVGVSVDRIHVNREPVGYHKFHEEAIDDEAQALVEITEPERNGPTLRLVF